MDDLVVNNQFTSTVVDDEGTDTAAAIAVGLTDALEETTLADDREALAQEPAGLRLGYRSERSVGASPFPRRADSVEGHHFQRESSTGGCVSGSRVVDQCAGELVGTAVQHGSMRSAGTA